MSNAVRQRLEKEAARLERKYGHRTGALGSARFERDVVPTGSLALDYALGTGGWRMGHPIEVYGAEDIGKSSAIGLSALANAQKAGLTTGIVALEPGFDPDWAAKNGVDPELLVIARPNQGEEAFQILHDWVTDDVVDFMVFDSVGAVMRPSEADPDGKPNQGGASALVTWGVRRILQPVWKNSKGVIFLNQVRDDMKSRIPGQVESPGGHALKHGCDVRIHLRPGKDRYTLKVEGEDVIVGRQLIAHIKRNKLSEGSNRKAMFDFYQMDTEDRPVGIDWTTDTIATGKRTGVIKRAGAWYRHPSFPGDKHQIQSEDAVDAYLEDHPESVEAIRKDVLEVMVKKQGEIKAVKPDLKAFDGAVQDG